MKKASDWVRECIREEVLDINAYHVPDSSGLVKLDAMENPFSLPESLIEPWAKLVANTPFNRYPDPESRELVAAIRQTYGLTDQGVLLGNGSDELIQLLGLALNKPGATMLSLEPSFVMYKMTAHFLGMAYQGVALNEDFTVDEQVFLAAVNTHQPALTFIAYPNNPTGQCFSESFIESVLRASSGIVVVDEAYHIFSDKTFLGELDRFPNLVVLRTFSKMGLAGLRLGFMVAAPELVTEINKLRMPYNINVLTQVAVKFCLEHLEMFNTQAKQILTERDRVVTQLAEINGLNAYPTDANFILVKVLQDSARALFEQLKQDGVLIKCLDGAHPLLDNTVRLTIGTPAENNALITALKKSLGAA